MEGRGESDRKSKGKGKGEREGKGERKRVGKGGKVCAFLFCFYFKWNLGKCLFCFACSFILFPFPFPFSLNLIPLPPWVDRNGSSSHIVKFTFFRLKWVQFLLIWIFFGFFFLLNFKLTKRKSSFVILFLLIDFSSFYRPIILDMRDLVLDN